MIKIVLENKAYHYDKIGNQPYDLNMTIEMEQDCTAIEVITALMEILKTATYRVNARTLMDAAWEYAYENDQEDLLRECSVKESNK